MLIYHPAFDVYHCAFRMLAIAEISGKVEIETARLLDFYLLFPSAIAAVTLPTELSSARSQAKSARNPYRDPLNPKATFRDMKILQETALRCVAASGLIDSTALEEGFLERSQVPFPTPLDEKIAAFIVGQPLSDFVLNQLSKIPLRGLHGLKHRTKLLDHMYDVA